MKEESSISPEANETLYADLWRVLEAAYSQAADGKGRERHADGEPFEQQQICEMARRLSVDGPLYQAVKKIYETKKLPPKQAIFELLGAINYIAAAVIVLEEKA